MTKADLLKFLEPFTDECEILVSFENSSIIFEPCIAKYVQCEKMKNGNFTSDFNPSKSEGCIIIS